MNQKFTKQSIDYMEPLEIELDVEFDEPDPMPKLEPKPKTDILK